MNVKVKKLHPKAVIPKKAFPGDAGLDLVAVEESWEDTQVTYDTGLALEIPEGYVGLVFPRSSIYQTRLELTNSVGVIDSGYRGSIKLKFNYYEEGYVYDIGDKVAQLIIIPIPEINLEEVDELNPSERGEKGYGSSGK